MAARPSFRAVFLAVLGTLLAITAPSCEGTSSDLERGPTPTPHVAPSPTPSTLTIADPTPTDTPPTEVAPDPTSTPAPTATATTVDTPTPRPEPTSTKQPPLGDPVLMVGDQPFRIEFAITFEEQSRGLSARDHLDPDAGMLFVFSRERRLSFWMKETLIPLDLIYLDANGTVVSIHTMQPEPGVQDAFLTRYTSDGPALYALEVNAGVANELGLQPGDLFNLADVLP